MQCSDEGAAAAAGEDTLMDGDEPVAAPKREVMPKHEVAVLIVACMSESSREWYAIAGTCCR